MKQHSKLQSTLVTNTGHPEDLELPISRKFYPYKVDPTIFIAPLQDFKKPRELPPIKQGEHCMAPYFIPPHHAIKNGRFLNIVLFWLRIT